MPDHFIALVSQYTGALNTAQSERYAKAVIDAWYFSLPRNGQLMLSRLLPDYLTPKRKLFYSQRSQKTAINQSQIFRARLTADLSRSNFEEVEPIARGVLKSLKILSSTQKKFAYSKLLTPRLAKLYIEA